GARLEIVTLLGRLGDREAARAELSAIDLRDAAPVTVAAARLAAVNLRVRWDEAPLDEVHATDLLAELDAADELFATAGRDDPKAKAADEMRGAVVTARALVKVRAQRYD